MAPDGVAIMTDISKYLDFVLKMFFAFGLAFEVPIATILIVWAGITTPEKLADKRPYIVVGVFVFAMLLTPPDAISQTLLAVPMLLLFELGLFFSKGFVRESEEEELDEELHEPDSSEKKSKYESEDFDEMDEVFKQAQQEEDALNRNDKS